MGKSYTAQLTELLCDLRYSDIPADVVEQVKKLTLHVVGVSIASAPTEQCRNSIELVQSRGGVEEATVWCSKGRKAPIENAAFANGTMTDILDWEDCSWIGHPTPSAIPVCLGFAERDQKPGRDYILNMVACLEGYTRAGMAMQPTAAYVKDGFRFPLLSVSVLCSAIAAAKCLGLDKDKKKFEQVFGALSYHMQVPTNKHAHLENMSDIWHYGQGIACRNGVEAAMMTAQGFDNCYAALDDWDGLWKMISDRHRPEWYTKDWKKAWYTNEIVMKHWPINIWVEAPVDGMAALYNKHRFAMKNVKAVRISPPANILVANYAKSARGMLDAMFNIAYCCTVYLMKPDNPGYDWFTPEMRNSGELIEFTKKFTYPGEPAITYDHFVKFMGTGEFPEVTVEVELDDGAVYKETLRYPKGHPRNNFTLDECGDHFRRCCEPFLDAKKIEKFVDAIRNLEKVDNMRPIAELLSFGK
ncbi:MAG: MmgE/PrpD family protein [Planctomycetota bacterium]|nr:MmgE/PrpD family protein [Planctomycetota bacterium]